MKLLPGRARLARSAAALRERGARLLPQLAEGARSSAWTRRAARVLARISAQLYLGIGGAVALTFVASLVGWLAFDRVGDAQSQVNETSLPQLAGSFAVAQHGSALAVAASRVVGATTPAALAAIEASVRSERQVFEIELSALTSQSGERFDRVRIEGGALVTNLDALHRSAGQRFELRARRTALGAELAAVEAQLTNPSRNAALAVQVLTNALNAPDGGALATMRGRFANLVDGLSGRGGPVGRLRDLGLARRGVFELAAEWLTLDERQQALLTENARYAAGLLAAIEELVSEARDGAADATSESDAAIGTGRTLLIVINGISIVAAVLIAWLFVGRVLVPRLQRLSDRMRAMAEGDLEGEVDISGRDEVADMAAALEVFRRHALEVQRLNLVEKLAEELRGKNEQLEATLAQLRQAQNQIVAQEKLAGLGELTAGVAHEIRNPLNFVFNYSEGCVELLEEMNEELAATANGFTDAQKELLQPLCTDLDDSLQRIRTHGGRADRIVRDMLKMGSSSGERQNTDINRLLQDQVRVTADLIRGAGTQAPVVIQEDLDPGAGELDIVPQDMGRVLQNLLLNAWYATEERGRQEAEGGRDYEPAVQVSTRRLEERLEIRVRDNGTGIPADVVDKIFNPFFTTKPTDQGTGLGLSLCNDILRGHGGNIRVDTEAGSYTEMIVELPTMTMSGQSASEDP